MTTLPPAATPAVLPPETHVYFAAAAVCVATFLTWFSFPDLGGQVGNPGELFSALSGGQFSGSFSGFKTGEGKVAFFAAIVCAGLTWADASGSAKWDRAHSLLGAAAAGAVALIAPVVGWVNADPLKGGFGLYLAIVAGGALAYLAIQRLNAHNRNRPTPAAGA
jgi:hypothetical protein